MSAANQANLFTNEVALTTDMYVLLQLFTNYRGIDIPQDFFGLSHVYHSVYTHPDKRPKTSWSEARVRKAIDACEEAGLIAYGNYHDGHKWMITERGLKARCTAFQIAQHRTGRKA